MVELGKWVVFYIVVIFENRIMTRGTYDAICVFGLYCNTILIFTLFDKVLIVYYNRYLRQYQRLNHKRPIAEIYFIFDTKDAMAQIESMTSLKLILSYHMSSDHTYTNTRGGWSGLPHIR